jgi:hypothetical protein
MTNIEIRLNDKSLWNFLSGKLAKNIDAAGRTGLDGKKEGRKIEKERKQGRKERREEGRKARKRLK